MSVEYDLYVNPPSTKGRKVTRMHARVSSANTVNLKELAEEVEEGCSFSRADWVAALAHLENVFAEKLARGNRVYIEGIGYFQMTLSCPPDVKDPHDVRAESIHFKSIAFTPEKGLRRQLSGTKFVRRTGDHTKGYSEIELMGILTDYFKANEYITRYDLERVCVMTRSTAYRYIKRCLEAKMMKCMPGIDAYCPVAGWFGVSREE